MNRRFILEANHPKLSSTFSTRYQVLTAMTIYKGWKLQLECFLVMCFSTKDVSVGFVLFCLLKAAFDKYFGHYLGAMKLWQEGSEELLPIETPERIFL